MTASHERALQNVSLSRKYIHKVQLAIPAISLAVHPTIPPLVEGLVMDVEEVALAQPPPAGCSQR